MNGYPQKYRKELAMSIKEAINEKLKIAMKEHDEATKLTLRMAMAAIKFAEKENKADLSDDEALTLIQREVKIRNEQIADAEKSGRTESIQPLKTEIDLLESFLPKQLSEEELIKIIDEAAVEIGVSTPKEMGALMKAVLPKVKGIAANNLVSAAVKKYLESK